MNSIHQATPDTDIMYGKNWLSASVVYLLALYLQHGPRGKVHINTKCIYIGLRHTNNPRRMRGLVVSHSGIAVTINYMCRQLSGGKIVKRRFTDLSLSCTRVTIKAQEGSVFDVGGRRGGGGGGLS